MPVEGSNSTLIFPDVWAGQFIGSCDPATSGCGAVWEGSVGAAVEVAVVSVSVGAVASVAVVSVLFVFDEQADSVMLMVMASAKNTELNLITNDFMDFLLKRICVTLPQYSSPKIHSDKVDYSMSLPPY